MTERPQDAADVSACPFVAFEDERDERSSRPDHRHRCYADVRPAPRALAHQAAYCLSPAFTACPTFQDWARREAARVRTPAPKLRGRSDDEPEVRAAPRGPHAWASPPPWVDDGTAEATDGAMAAPNPLPVTAGGELWATATLGRAVDWSPGDADDDGVAREVADARGDPDTGRFISDAERGASRAVDVDDARFGDRDSRVDERDAEATPAFLAPRAWPIDRQGGRPDRGAGLVGSAALAAAGGTGSDDADDGDEGPPLRRVVGPSGGRSPVAPAGRGRPGDRGAPPDDHGRRPLGRGAAPAGRAGRARAAHEDGAAHSLHGPDWEQPQRFEAYPTLRTRVGLPNVPGIALGFGALVIAAAALFFIPPLILKPGGVGDPGANATPTPSMTAGPSVPTSPTPVPAPTPETYTIQSGDTLSSVAAQYKITLAKLIAANPSIKNPDKVAIGDVIIIPTPGSNDVLDAGGSGSPSASP